MPATKVVITGMGVASPIGCSLAEVTESLTSGRHGVVAMPRWVEQEGMKGGLAAPVRALPARHHPRKKVRGMGRVATLALHATADALEDAGLVAADLAAPSTGLAYGSGHGSSSRLFEALEDRVGDRVLSGVTINRYLAFMAHTCAANLAHYYDVSGAVIPTIAGCVSSSLALGTALDTIRCGRQRVMICGGAEELHHVVAGAYDIMRVNSSAHNDRPDQSPRPFDVDRDGLVVGEGAATLVLEEREAALRRGARVYGELLGFGFCCDGSDLLSPTVSGMRRAMGLALADAGASADDIDYVNAHALGTPEGDLQESLATAEVLGPDTPVSSTTGATGHTIGACGALQAIFCLLMMRHGFLAPTRNLLRVDPKCASLAYLKGDAVQARPRTVMSNNFGFGGLCSSLILRLP